MAFFEEVHESRYGELKGELEAVSISSAKNFEGYERFFENRTQFRRSVTKLSSALQTLIFQEKGDTECDVSVIIEYILGTESHWCSGSLEVRELRKALAESFECEWREFQKMNFSMSLSRAMRLLPQRFFVFPLEEAQQEMLTQLTPRTARDGGYGVVLLCIWYVDLMGCTCSTLREFSFDTTASEAIATTMERLFLITNFDKNMNQGVYTYIFKARGRNEYVYGDEPLINFRYIREGVTQQQETHVIVEPYEKGLLTDPVFTPSYNTVAKTHEKECKQIDSHQSFADLSPEISLWNLDGKLKVNFVDNLSNVVFSSQRAKEEGVREGDTLYLAMLVEVYFGVELVCRPQLTKWVMCGDLVGSRELNTSSTVSWGHGVEVAFDMLLSDAPRELKLCITLVATCGGRLDYRNLPDPEELVDHTKERFGVKMNGKCPTNSFFFLGSASVQLFDYLARMRMGRLDLCLWGGRKKANPMCPIPLNPNKNDIGLSLVFPTFHKIVVIPGGPPPLHKKRNFEQQFLDNELQLAEKLRESKIEQLKQLKRILISDPLTKLTFSDKVLLWKHREELVMRPTALVKFLLAVNWLQPYAVYETHALLGRWAPLQPIDALELLDARYADIIVREYAVNSLHSMSDYELRGCVLQLVQVLKHEPYHDSALFRFLLQRSLRSPHMIGHYVFWYLVSEMENTAVCERHGLLLEELIRRVPNPVNYLRQLYVADKLLESAIRVKNAPKKDRVDVLRGHLKSLRLPRRFTLALNPAMECSGIDISQCKVMNSKKSPLWLVFCNSQKGGDPFCVLFKIGDDLRQDLLTLQLLELMDTHWKSCGLNLHIIPYGCIATGEGVGMLEVVLNSDTVANITRTNGGAQAAFSEEPLMNWLRQFNKERNEVERCLWNFLYSAAGYAVATYVLGIGDRHNDNIMLRQDGTLFHIDFGHFLGNFKRKFGIKRETAPFVFTPMYAYMLGGQNSPIFLYFVDVACHAFNVVRRFSGTLMTLFMLMLSTGIPELQRVEDIEWLRGVLLVDRSDEEAAEHYRLQISLALTNVRSLLNDCIHIMTH